jgi:hypothetical protein
MDYKYRRLGSVYLDHVFETHSYERLYERLMMSNRIIPNINITSNIMRTSKFYNHIRSKRGHKLFIHLPRGNSLLTACLGQRERACTQVLMQPP